MRITLATPLYPPDIAEPAPYIKELARRLSKENSVNAVVYGHLPEQVPHVRILAVSKRQPLFIRIPKYLFVLWRTVRTSDIIYAENGASVELPASLVSLLTRRPLIIHVGDKNAHERAGKNALYSLVKRFAFSQAYQVVYDTPREKPEILPLEPRPEAAIAQYEALWASHLASLRTIFDHGTQRS